MPGVSEIVTGNALVVMVLPGFFSRTVVGMPGVNRPKGRRAMTRVGLAPHRYCAVTSDPP